MVLLSCSGTGGGIYAKTSKRSGSTQLRSGFPYLPAVREKLRARPDFASDRLSLSYRCPRLLALARARML